ncbi:MAG: NAD regulator [Alphaproteobacteria bacterium HGW-Alphaproteobacteria-11]|nr:MAG: NAD regulator [Alphaproteobacteria bacterium HGW-Alphaproteobacteria-11]
MAKAQGTISSQSAAEAAMLADKAVVIGLNAAIVTVSDDQPKILVVPHDETDGASGWDALPFGPFNPVRHRTLEIGLRAWVQEQTQLELGYVEQLYTFGDRGRHSLESDAPGEHVVSVGYLALTRGHDEALKGAAWRDWYQYFPWEDWRAGKPPIIDQAIVPLLREWAGRQSEAPPEELARGKRRDRMRLCFGMDGVPWDDEKALERYELLYSAGLLLEAARDGRPNARGLTGKHAPNLGRPMQFDHRRILATAMGRLRAKIKYRPVAFELMPPSFTLYELQKTVEALLGLHVHKQNFRRLVENAGLVERTGRMSTRTGGRPAEQFRFRREVLNERPAPGLKLAPSRSRANS